MLPRTLLGICPSPQLHFPLRGGRPVCALRAAGQQAGGRLGGGLPGHLPALVHRMLAGPGRAHVSFPRQLLGACSLSRPLLLPALPGRVKARCDPRPWASDARAASQVPHALPPLCAHQAPRASHHAAPGVASLPAHLRSTAGCAALPLPDPPPPLPSTHAPSARHASGSIACTLKQRHCGGG